jgi:hypothetical protein
MASRVSGWWYLLALVPVAIGGIIAAVAMSSLLGDIEGMKRVVVPGEATLELGAGDYVVYGELQSTVDGVAYRATSVQVRCMMTTAGGEGVILTTPGASTSYSLGGYQGQSMFEFTIREAGTFQLVCQNDGDPAVLAIGHGIGAGIAVVAIGMGAGFIGAIVVLLLVRRKRKRAAA